MEAMTPQNFTRKYPNYVYRSGKGQETVQWRKAALDMADDRAKLIEALRWTLALMEKPNGSHTRTYQVRYEHAAALLRELVEST